MSLLAEDGVHLAVAATGLLRTFNEAGVLEPADVHVARRLGRLGAEDDETVLLAAALTVRALRGGSVCLDLAAVDRTVLGENDEVVDRSDLPWPELEPWRRAVAASPLTGGPEETTGRPLRLAGDLLYLDRYFRQEEQVRADLAERDAAEAPPADPERVRAALDRLAEHATARGEQLDARQRLACVTGVLRRVSVIAGGPGTGKTTTVATLLAVLLADDPGLRVALAAPTGKAAARLEEAIATAELPAADRDRVGRPAARTLHRLLGRRPGSTTRFQYHRGRRLPFDVVVVDETSMVSLTLMARLLEAVRPDARLVLVGDPDQLRSVEAGAVLGDLVEAFGRPSEALGAAQADLGAPTDPDDPARRGVVRLETNHRNNPEIAALAAAVRAGDGDEAQRLLRAGGDSLSFVESAALEEREPAGLDDLRATVVADAERAATAAARGDGAEALAALDDHRLLCAHRRGPYGVGRWAAQVTGWLAEAGGPAVPGDPADGNYPGRPLLITANDYEQGLYNGDTGVVVADPLGPRAVFGRGGKQVVVPPALLDRVETVHAMTVHRAQGSQFAAVTLVLPPANSPLLTRELLYTAVTRARGHVRIVGSAEALRAAVDRPANRASGFARRG